MTNFINYLTEANICLLLFALLYLLLLRNGDNFLYARRYIVAALLFSAVVPLIQFTNFNNEIPALHQVIPATILDGVTINEKPANLTSPATIAKSYSRINWVMLFYFSIAALLLLRLLVQVNAILKIKKGAERKEKIHNKFSVLEGAHIGNTFSFFNTIFLSKSSYSNENERNNVITHELIHARQKHSFDILLSEILKIVFWFNPVLWYLKSSLIEVHEYEADSKSLNHIDIKTYSNQLARVALMSADLKLANHFNKSLILKRLKMMKTGNKKLQLWKNVLIWMVVPVIFIAISCQEQTMTEIQGMTKNATVAFDLPPHVQSKYDKMVLKNPDSKVIALRVNQNEMDGRSSDKLKEYSALYGKPQELQVIKEKPGDQEGYILMVFNKDSATLSDWSKDEHEVFTIVEESAEPLSGMDAYYKFLTENIQYPSEAKEANIEGKVYVEFVIEKNGTLSNIRVVKGIGYGCDKEAARVIQLGENWKPGKQRGKIVKQKIILPITFSLSPGHTPAPNKLSIESNDKMTITFETVAYKQGTVIQGTVYNGDRPMPGTNIVINGTKMGTVSDLQGQFKLKVPQGNKKITASFVGFDDYTIHL